MAFQKFAQHIEDLRGTGYDVYTRAHDECFADLLQDNQDLSTVFKDFFDLVQLDPSQAALRINKSTQAMEMATDVTFPEGRDYPKAWEPTLLQIIEDETYQQKFLTNLVLPIASNVSERGKLLKAVLVLHGLNQSAQIIDVGCSLNHNLKRLTMHQSPGFDYQDIEVVNSKQPSHSPEERRLTNFLTTVVKHLIQETDLQIGSSTGVDIFDADRDPFFREWARSNSFYMSERLNNEKINQFEQLMAARPDQVKFKFMDIASPLSEDDVQQKADVVYLSTMLYQLNPQERRTALINADLIVRPEGLIVVQDFVDFGPRGSSKYYKRQDWDWNYNLWVKDMKNPKIGFQKYFQAESGRVKKIIIQPAVGRLGLAKEMGIQFIAKV